MSICSLLNAKYKVYLTALEKKPTVRGVLPEGVKELSEKGMGTHWLMRKGLFGANLFCVKVELGRKLTGSEGGCISETQTWHRDQGFEEKKGC